MNASSLKKEIYFHFLSINISCVCTCVYIHVCDFGSKIANFNISIKKLNLYRLEKKLHIKTLLLPSLRVTLCFDFESITQSKTPSYEKKERARKNLWWVGNSKQILSACSCFGKVTVGLTIGEEAPSSPEVLGCYPACLANHLWKIPPQGL